MGRTKDKVVEDCRNRNQSAYRKAIKRAWERERKTERGEDERMQTDAC